MKKIIRHNHAHGWNMGDERYEFNFGTLFRVVWPEGETVVQYVSHATIEGNPCDSCFFSTRNDNTRYSCAGVDCIMVEIKDPMHAALLESKEMTDE